MAYDMQDSSAKPAYNADGVPHMYCGEGIPAAEAAELREQLKDQEGYNVDHESTPVFNPASSKAQFRAMYAAKTGHSTLGIPKSVGADFVAATKNPGKLPARKRHG